MNNTMQSEFLRLPAIESATNRDTLSEKSIRDPSEEETNAFSVILHRSDPKASSLHDEDHQFTDRMKQPLSEDRPLTAALSVSEPLDETNRLSQTLENVSPYPNSTPQSLTAQSIRLPSKLEEVGSRTEHSVTLHLLKVIEETTSNPIAQADSKSGHLGGEHNPEASGNKVFVLTNNPVTNGAEIETLPFGTYTGSLKRDSLENIPEARRAGETNTINIAAQIHQELPQKNYLDGTSNLPKLAASTLNPVTPLMLPKGTDVGQSDEKSHNQNDLKETIKRTSPLNTGVGNEIDGDVRPASPPNPAPNQRLLAAQAVSAHQDTTQSGQADERTTIASVISGISQSVPNENKITPKDPIVAPLQTFLQPRKMEGFVETSIQPSVRKQEESSGNPQSASIIKTEVHDQPTASGNDFVVQSIESAVKFHTDDRGVNIGELGVETTRASMPQSTPFVVQQSSQSDIARSIAQQLTAVLPDVTNNQIELALSPDELGRVKLTFSPTDGAINVLLVAERPETLELMKRNIDTLAQDFAKLGYESISFSFGQSTSGRDGNSDPQKSSSPHILGGPEFEDEGQVTPLTIHFAQSESVDIRI